MGKRIGIVGTRFTELHSSEWRSKLHEAIDSLPSDAEIVVNGAPGVDQEAATYASGKGLKVTILFPGDTYSDDPRYFVHRNGLVVENADELYAFWDDVSAGTLHAITIAKHAGIPCHVIHALDHDWQRFG